MSRTLGGRRIGRPTAALAAVILSTLAFAGGASGAPSTHVEEHYVSVVGVPITTAGASAYLHAYQSNVIGSDAGFQLWIEPDLPWTGPPNYTSGPTDFVVGAGDSSLAGTFDIVDRDGAVAGIGVLNAALSPTGAPEDVTWPKTTGNRKHRESQVYQQMAVSGTLTATIGQQEFVFGLAGSSGFAADFTAFENNPASTVDWRTFTDLGFSATDGDMSVQVSMSDEGGNAISEVVVQGGDEVFIGLDDGTGTTFGGGRYALDLALVPSGGGNGIVAASATGGTIVGSATVRPAERFAWSEDLGGGTTLRIVVQSFTVSGSFTVSLDDGTTRTFTMDDASAFAQRVSSRLFVKPAR